MAQPPDSVHRTAHTTVVHCHHTWTMRPERGKALCTTRLTACSHTILCGNCSPPLADLAESRRSQVGVASFKGDRTFLRGQSPYINCPARVPKYRERNKGCIPASSIHVAHPASSCVWWRQKSTQSNTPSLSGCSSLRPQIRSYTHTSLQQQLCYTLLHVYLPIS